MGLPPPGSGWKADGAGAKGRSGLQMGLEGQIRQLRKGGGFNPAAFPRHGGTRLALRKRARG